MSEQTSEHQTTRRERHLQEQLNRVKNLAPGRGRIFKLDHVAMLLEHDADMDEVAGVDAAFITETRNLAVFVRRLAYDLWELRDAARGDTKRAVSNRNDPTQWRGERP